MFEIGALKKQLFCLEGTYQNKRYSLWQSYLDVIVRRVFSLDNMGSRVEVVWSDWINIKEKELFTKYGFTITGSQLENGVPVYKMLKI